MASEGPRQGTPSIAGGPGGFKDWPEHTEGGLGDTDGCFGKAEVGLEHTEGGLEAVDGGFGRGEDWPEQPEGGLWDTGFGSAESGTGDDVLHKGGCHCGAIIWQVTAPANPTGAPTNLTF